MENYCQQKKKMKKKNEELEHFGYESVAKYNNKLNKKKYHHYENKTRGSEMHLNSRMVQC